MAWRQSFISRRAIAVTISVTPLTEDCASVDGFHPLSPPISSLSSWLRFLVSLVHPCSQSLSSQHLPDTMKKRQPVSGITYCRDELGMLFAGLSVPREEKRRLAAWWTRKMYRMGKCSKVETGAPAFGSVGTRGQGRAGSRGAAHVASIQLHCVTPTTQGVPGVHYVQYWCNTWVILSSY
jgi:hypothetical protein